MKKGRGERAVGKEWLAGGMLFFSPVGGGRERARGEENLVKNLHGF